MKQKATAFSPCPFCLYRGGRLHDIPYEGTVFLRLGWESIQGEQTRQSILYLSQPPEARDETAERVIEICRSARVDEKERQYLRLFNALEFFLLTMTAACRCKYVFHNYIIYWLKDIQATNENNFSCSSLLLSHNQTKCQRFIERIAICSTKFVTSECRRIGWCSCLWKYVI